MDGASELQLWETLRLVTRNGDVGALSLIEQHTPALPPGPTRAALEAMIAWTRGERECAFGKIASALGERDRSGPLEVAAGLMALDRGQRSIALWHFRRAERSGLSDPRIPTGLAVIALEDGTPDTAHTLLQSALRIDPWHWHARFLLGLVSSSLGRSREALACFRRVTEESPGYELGWKARLVQAQALREDDEAAFASAELFERFGGVHERASEPSRLGVRRQPRAAEGHGGPA